MYDLIAMKVMSKSTWFLGSSIAIRNMHSWEVHASISVVIIFMRDEGCRAGGAGPVGQAKTGPLFSLFGQVIVANTIAW